MLQQVSLSPNFRRSTDITEIILMQVAVGEYEKIALSS